MSVISNRSVTIAFSSGIEYSQEFGADPNGVSSGDNYLIDLASGNNTITVPTGAVAVTMIPPGGNTIVWKLKGVAGDTGVSLHLTDPTSIGLNTVSTFVLNAASALASVRFIYS